MNHSLLIIITLALTALANNLYVIKDKSGNTLLETQDSVLVKQFTNVVIETIDQSPKVILINDTGSVENINAIIEHKISKPEKAIFYYSKEWKTPNNGHLTLNKNAKSKSAVIADGLAIIWLKSNIPALFDSIDIKPEIKMDVKPKKSIAELDSEITSIEKKKK